VSESGQEAADVRQCRLRPEYSHLYEGIPPDVWLPAGEVVRALIMRLDGHLRLHEPHHFEFRGGEPEQRSPDVRTRPDD
jgi:hypothetical protein